MSDSLPEELLQTKELINEGKVKKALEIIIKFEKKPKNSPEDQLYISYQERRQS